MHKQYKHKCGASPPDEYGDVGFYKDTVGDEVSKWYAGAPYERIYGIKFCPWCGEKLTNEG